MSAKVQALVWEYYSPDLCGAPLILALALADEADDHGGGIFQSNPALARKTRQKDRAVRMQLRRLEACKLLRCVQRSVGGAGKFSQYELDIATLIVLKNPAPETGITRHQEPGFLEDNPASGTGLSDPHYKDCKDLNLFVEDGTRNRVHAEAEVEDERLAKWMLERLRALNPKHREPSWRTWLRDLRIMRERDKRTHRELAELFAWANADQFWQANILSPAKLREKWDQLQLRRRANGGSTHQSGVEDRSCVGRIDGGALCAKPGAFKSPDGKWRCHGCRESAEAQGTHA